ncbi:uncharacterized protein LOC129001739 [Macrosteles quadrilineatus]|uniref:uncharacterized protein LOC129001739 n=1 Tax=Macrosteles quadrilineatus TaxID=74068 RepID=UPI0023E1A8C8|nr:uncharacterized protein LOC129001739 [Macrosteles quadrilineatus]
MMVPETYLPRCSEKYFGIFPPNLFLCVDNLHCMHFILCLKHIKGAELKDLIELLQHCGAYLSFSLRDATDYSAIIVDHNEIIDFKAPAFTIEYLEECLRESQLLQISDTRFRQATTSHIARDVDCMKVVFFRQCSWDAVLSDADKKWFETESINKTMDVFNPLVSSTCIGSPTSPEERIEPRTIPESSEAEQPSASNNQSHNSKQVMLSDDDDSDLTEPETMEVDETHEKGEHLNKDLTCEVNGPNSPKEDEEVDDSNRPNCSGFVCLATSQQNESGKNKRSKETASTSNQPSKKWAFLDEFHPTSESDDETSSSAAAENKRKKEEEVKKKKLETFFDFDCSKEDTQKPTKDAKHSRLPYSYNEQANILKYITVNCEYARLKGRELWMIMERRNICPNRTWQSMKEHFVKKIITNIEAFDFLTESDKLKLKTSFY